MWPQEAIMRSWKACYNRIKITARYHLILSCLFVFLFLENSPLFLVIHWLKYSYLSDTVLDLSPNKLTPQEKHLCLIDVGYFINTSCPPLLKPERNVDVIISLDYSMGNVFQVRWFKFTIACCTDVTFPTRLACHFYFVFNSTVIIGFGLSSPKSTITVVQKRSNCWCQKINTHVGLL